MSDPRAPRRSTRRAFTLVEVLVTLGIMGLLIALATSGVRSALSGARSSACSNNLRQMGVAARLYSTDNRASFPAAVVYFQQAGSIRTVAWDYESSPGGVQRPGAVTSYTDHPQGAMRCPEFPSPSTSAPSFTGYNYNTTFIGHEGFLPEVGEDGVVRDGWSRVRMGLNASQQRNASRVALFADAGFKGGGNKFMRAPGNRVEMDAGLIHAGTNSYCHAGCCNGVFLDGHCSSFSSPCQSPFSNDQLLKFVTDFPRNGFLSADDSAYDPR